MKFTNIIKCWIGETREERIGLIQAYIGTILLTFLMIGGYLR